MKQLNAMLTSYVVFALIGCAHLHKVDGPQAEHVIPDGYRVQIGSPEVKDGDTVSVFRRLCSKTSVPVRGNPIKVDRCKNIAVGSARIIKVIDHDSAIVKPDGDLKIDDSMVVEKEKP